MENRVTALTHYCSLSFEESCIHAIAEQDNSPDGLDLFIMLNNMVLEIITKVWGCFLTKIERG